MRSKTLPGPTRLWDVIGLLARLLLAAVFIIFGWEKASEPLQMEIAVEAYRLVPESFVDPIVAVLPYLEIAVGALLLLGLATRLGGILCSLMMLAFLTGIFWAVFNGLNIDCGCSGGGGVVANGQTNYTEEILRDVGLLIASLYLSIRPRSLWSIDGLGRRGPAIEEDGVMGDEGVHDGDHDDTAGHTVAGTHGTGPGSGPPDSRL